MSEDNTPPPPSTPKTSAVPLKKETVRITLRPREESAPEAAAPSAGETPRRTTAPVQLPSAPLPPPAPKIASSPVKLPPAAPPPAAFPAPAAATPPPAATVPLTSAAPAAPRPPTAPAAPMAPRPPTVPGAAPRVETGATTAPLTKPAAPKPPGTVGTAPLTGAPAAGLPKATVKLQQTQPMSRPSIGAPPSAPVKRAAAADSQQFYEETDPEAGLMPLSAICFVAAAALLVLQMFGGDMISAEDDSPLMVPHSKPAKWEVYNKDDGTWMNQFASQLPAIPQ